MISHLVTLFWTSWSTSREACSGPHYTVTVFYGHLHAVAVVPCSCVHRRQNLAHNQVPQQVCFLVPVQHASSILPKLLAQIYSVWNLYANTVQNATSELTSLISRARQLMGVIDHNPTRSARGGCSIAGSDSASKPLLQSDALSSNHMSRLRLPVQNLHTVAEHEVRLHPVSCLHIKLCLVVVDVPNTALPMF